MTPAQQFARLLTVFADGIEQVARDTAVAAFVAEGVPAEHASFAVERTMAAGFTSFDIIAQAATLAPAWVKAAAVAEGVED